MTKTNKTRITILAIIIAIATMFMAVLLKDSKLGLTRTFSKRCLYEGKEYKYGDGFKASDGCNSCSCGEDGQVACTLMFCD